MSDELRARIVALEDDLDGLANHCDLCVSECTSPYIAREYMGEARAFRSAAQKVRDLLKQAANEKRGG